MAYPKFLYHPELAPAGRLIRDEASEPTEPGWVDTPQKFDPAYVEPAPIVPEGSVPADRPGYVPQPYPSVRYGASGETKVVASADEDAALNPADWKHSPAHFLDEPPAVVAPPPPPAVPVVIDPLNPPPEVPTENTPPAPQLKTDPPQVGSAKQKAALYAANAADVIDKVKGMSDIATLQMVKGFEESNPSKRVTVIKAVDKRLADLGYVAPDA